MIFDLLTSPQGHQFNPRILIYLHSVLLVIAVDLIFHMTMFDISRLMCLNLSFVRTNTKFGIKIFEIDFVIEIK